MHLGPHPPHPPSDHLEARWPLGDRRPTLTFQSRLVRPVSTGGVGGVLGALEPSPRQMSHVAALAGRCSHACWRGFTENTQKLLQHSLLAALGERIKTLSLSLSLSHTNTHMLAAHTHTKVLDISHLHRDLRQQ